MVLGPHHASRCRRAQPLRHDPGDRNTLDERNALIRRVVMLGFVPEDFQPAPGTKPKIKAAGESPAAKSSPLPATDASKKSAFVSRTRNVFDPIDALSSRIVPSAITLP